LLLRPRESLDAMLLAQCRAPRPHPARPRELHRQPRAGVARRPARRVGAHACREVFRGPGVERAVPAAQDVDERQRATP
jgi:hypothetical protein